MFTWNDLQIDKYILQKVTHRNKKFLHMAIITIQSYCFLDSAILYWYSFTFHTSMRLFLEQDHKIHV